MDITLSTRAYEKWMREQIPVVKGDLGLKHRRMAESAFVFLRGTFYRWMQLWPATCPTLAAAPRVPSVGDLHVENFGTWRDSEGRLVWGVNDVDEACLLPYTQDLVRLATSAVLATLHGRFRMPARESSEAILEGYITSLSRGGAPARSRRAAAMASRDCPQRAARTQAILAEPGRAADGNRRRAARGPQARPSRSPPRVPRRPAYGWSRKPRPPAICRDCGVARSESGARSKSVAAVGGRLGDRAPGYRRRWNDASRQGREGAGPVHRGEPRMDRSTACARLLARGARRSAESLRRRTASRRDGMGNGKYPPWQKRREDRRGSQSAAPAMAGARGDGDERSGECRMAAVDALAQDPAQRFRIDIAAGHHRHDLLASKTVAHLGGGHHRRRAGAFREVMRRPDRETDALRQLRLG